MAVFNIPDIYGRFYLVNFDNVGDAANLLI